MKGTNRARGLASALVIGVVAAIGGGLVVGMMRPVAATTPAATATGVVPVTPFRVLDTRLGIGTGGVIAPLGPGATLDVQMAGVGSVPADAVGVVLNVTGTRASAPTFVATWPTGQARPETSTLNLTPGIDAPNAATALLGEGGRLSFYNDRGSADVIADVTGYLVAGAASTPGPAGPQGPAGPAGAGATVIDRSVASGGTADLLVVPGLTVRGNCTGGQVQVQFLPSSGSVWFYGTKLKEDGQISVKFDAVPSYSEASDEFMHLDGLLWVGAASPRYYQLSVQAHDKVSSCLFWIQMTPATPAG